MLILGPLMVAMGLAIAGVWARDIVGNPGVDRTRGLLRARDPSDGSPFLPHWIAEYATALGLIVGGVGLLADASWAEDVSLAALGALAYTSTNSLSWVLADPARRPYAIPMSFGIVLGLAGVVTLVAG